LSRNVGKELRNSREELSSHDDGLFETAFWICYNDSEFDFLMETFKI
jgi:hypothetical protein